VRIHITAGLLSPHASDAPPDVEGALLRAADRLTEKIQECERTLREQIAVDVPQISKAQQDLEEKKK
jgi:hypothetical protein